MTLRYSGETKSNCCYLTAIGDNGRMRKAIVQFSHKDGQFRIRNLPETTQSPFDGATDEPRDTGPKTES